MPTGQQSSPRPPIDVITSPFTRFARMEAAGGILLLLATAAAMAGLRWRFPFSRILVRLKY